MLGEALQRGPISRASLAECTGLTKATISILVEELLDLDLLVERGYDESGRVGRPGKLLEVNSESVVGVGLEINVDYIAVCVVDLLSGVRHRNVVHIDNRKGSVESAVAASAELAGGAIDEAVSQGMTPVGITVAVPGLVDVRTARLRIAPNLGWTNIAIGDMFAQRLNRPDLPVQIGNEANLGALGELWEGQGRSWGDFLHVSGEIGVGGGLVSGGRLLQGVDGFAGEFGHMQIDRHGPPCPCGSRGCLERFVGQEALFAAAGIDAEIATSIGSPAGGGIALLLDRARAGDRRTIDALDEAGEILGGACASVVHLFNPATVVLGGIFALIAPWILAPVEREANRGLARWTRRVDVAVSTLGPDAAVRGAAATTLKKILADPSTVPRPARSARPAAATARSVRADQLA